MKRSTNVIVSNLSGDNILFSTFYTGLFLLFGKTLWGGGHGPPWPLPLLRHCFMFLSASKELCGMWSRARKYSGRAKIGARAEKEFSRDQNLHSHANT